MTDALPSRSAQALEAVPAAAGTIVCPCIGLTLDQMQATLRQSPQMTFDRFLAVTNAGNRCTACLLDLEHHFVETSRRAPTAAGGISTKLRPEAAREPWRRRLLRLVDRWSPQMPLAITNVLPLIRGEEIEQFIWLANRSLLFEHAECAPPVTLALKIRDGEGSVLHQYAETIAPEASLRVNVSQYLASPPAGALAVGSVEITRRFARAGRRGTTRPQTEIVARDGACAVHGQGLSRAREGWFTVLARPGEDRLFLAMINGEERPQVIELSYPVVAGMEPRVQPVVLPPRGAQLVPIELKADELTRLPGTPFSVRWRPNGVHKVYALCATPSLGRFSIDHL